MEELNYQDGKKHGPVKSWFTNGTLKMSGQYKNDTFDGDILHFHLNGKPYIKGRFINGIRHGEWLYMNDNGIRDSVEIYNDGVLQEK